MIPENQFGGCLMICGAQGCTAPPNYARAGVRAGLAAFAADAIHRAEAAARSKRRRQHETVQSEDLPTPTTAEGCTEQQQ